MGDDTTWKRARLIPVAGIAGDREAEQRATSALLAVLCVVRDLSFELLTPMGASSAAKATVEAFTEVTLKAQGRTVRPDGLIRVSYGKRSFAALVEVKTGNSELGAEQVNGYWQAAREAGFDHVITISNQIAATGTHPVRGLRVRKNSPVQVSHLSWTRILATALRLKNHAGVDDPEQAWILEELVRYLQHDASGVLPLSDMGGSWTSIRDSARAGTLNRRSEGLRDVARRMDEIHTFAALMLSTEIGEDVDVLYPKSLRDRSDRIDAFVKAMIEGTSIAGRLRIPNTVGDIATEIDLRAQQLAASVEIMAPTDKQARGRVGWMVRQLRRAEGEVIVEAFPKNARIPKVALLEDAMEDPGLLLGIDRAEPHRFVVKRRVAMPHGRKSTARKPGFVDGYMALLADFYEGVVQDLVPWQPPAPKRKSKPARKDPEPAGDDWVWSPVE